MEFDIIVIGAGPAGETAAGELARRGRSVAIVERELVGGECAFYACMPSKALLRPAEVLAEAARVPGAAEAICGTLDVASTLRRRDEVISRLDDEGKLGWLDERGITLIRGHARLDGERSVAVAGSSHGAREAVVLATGSAAAIPPVPGLAEASPWTNREATTASAVPRSLVVLGGGVVGVELAQAYSELGAAVTVVEPLERLVSREEEFVSEQLHAALSQRGVQIHLGANATSVTRTADAVRVELEGGVAIEAAEILVAAGRRPLTEDLGLDSVGLREDHAVEVDEQMRVAGVPWLYAVGDVNGRALLTHVGKYQARVAAEVIAGGDARAVHDDATAPRVIFTDPQVAAVGLTLADARAHGLDAHAYDTETASTPGASFHGRNTAGTSRLIVDAGRSVVIGATFTGPEVAEWLQAATIAVVCEVPLARLRDAMPPFPTRSEVWLRLLEQVERE
jgi:pyruvate/2-oxoglutarate dehydrogenase complex dihydrolipoamide dehydrogenase (E3) component